MASFEYYGIAQAAVIEGSITAAEPTIALG